MNANELACAFQGRHRYSAMPRINPEGSKYHGPFSHIPSLDPKVTMWSPTLSTQLQDLVGTLTANDSFQELNLPQTADAGTLITRSIM